jgi:MFS family permease
MNAVHVLGPSVAIILGFGMAFVPVTMSAVSGVLSDQAWIASGIFQTSRHVEGAIGLAALAAGPVTHDAVRTAFIAGYTRAFIFAAIVAASAAVIGLVAAPPSSRGSRWWRHAICAVHGQPWHSEQHELDALVQAR